MLDMENKENETQQENEKASKLVVESPGQKPRRSVLKEFDPFAPDSPCVPKQKSKTPGAVVIDGDIFEDAETSLTAFVCPKKNNSPVQVQKSDKTVNGSRESWLIPELKEPSQQEEIKNLNDTSDMSFVEAVENLSQANETIHSDKTSSEDDFEFNIKNKESKCPENNLLNITTEKAISNDNIMVDSLEHTFNQLDSNKEDTQSSTLPLNDTHSCETSTQNPLVSSTNDISTGSTQNVLVLEKEDVQKNDDFGSIVDSLELPNTQDNGTVLNSTFDKQDMQSTDIMVDSLEVLENEENQSFKAVNEGSLKIDENRTVAPLLDTTFEASLKQDKAPSTPNTEVYNVNNVELNKTFESLDSNATQDNNTSQPNATSELKTATDVESSLNLGTTSSLAPTPSNIHKIEESHENTSVCCDKNNVHADPDGTFEITRSDTKADQLQNDKRENVLEECPEKNKTINLEHVIDDNNELLNDTGTSEANKSVLEWVLKEMIEVANQEEANIQKTEADMQKEKTNIKLTFDETSKTDLNPEIEAKEENKIPIAKVKESEDIDISQQDFTSPVSSKDIQEDEAESSKVMESLAQSLNQTIDVEESAIADDINSTKSADTSEDLSKDGLNLTIGNLKNAVGNSTTESEIEENIDGSKGSKVLERKETEEFEDYERQCYEESQIMKAGTDAPVSGPNVVLKDEIKLDPSKLYYRQDTQEFEALERECNEQTDKIDKLITENIETKRVQVEFQEMAATPIPNETMKDIKEPNTNNTHILESKQQKSEETTQQVNNAEILEDSSEEPNTRILESKKQKPEETIQQGNNTQILEDSSDGLAKEAQQEFAIDTKADKNTKNVKLVEETTKESLNGMLSNEPINLPKTAELVTVKVSGNMCKADLKSEDVIKSDIKEIHCMDANLFHDSNKETQVIDKPVSDVINKEANHVKESAKARHASNDLINKQLDEYKTKSEQLKSEVDCLQAEIDAVKKQNSQKDNLIVSCSLEIEAHREKNKQLQIVLKEYEQHINRQTQELEALKEESNNNAKHFTSAEMAFSDVFEKYEKAKTVIATYKKNEGVLLHNLQGVEDQLTKVEAKYSLMQEEYRKQLKKAEEQVTKEKEKYRQEMTKLQAMIKRLEIKASSLETALRQKTEECQALAALCDDITGKPM